MSFFHDKRGNVAMMVALCTLPIILLIGFAVEFSRQQAVESKLQAALDATVLAVALERKIGTKGQGQLRQIAEDSFNANNDLDIVVDLERMGMTLEEDETVLTLEGVMPTFLLGVIGQDHLKVKVMSGAVLGEPVAVEIALVLDVSNSMSGTRLDGLQVASKALINTLFEDDNENIQIGIVPFNDYVNVGTAHRNASWLDVPDDESGTYQSCPIDRKAAERAGCTFRTVCQQEGQFGAGSEGCREERTCPSGYELERKACTERKWENTWLGCVNSRAEPLNIEDGQFTGSPALGALMGKWEPCYDDNEIIDLTDDTNLLRRKIDKLRAGGQTYMAPGLAWGRRLLSSEEPFTQAKLSGIDGRQTIILLSDGANTVSRNGKGEHKARNSLAANVDTLAACDLIKQEGIDIYTIDYGVDDPVTEKLLQDCASGTDYAFEADSSNQLLQVFEDISSRFSSLALSR